MSLSDRRRYPRFPFHSRARLLLDDLEFNGTLVDISLAGALLALDQPLVLSPGAECRLAIYRCRWNPAESIGGLAVYSADHLLGMMFPEIGGAAESELRLLIEMNLASPRLLERDLPALLRSGILS